MTHNAGYHEQDQIRHSKATTFVFQHATLGSLLPGFYRFLRCSKFTVQQQGTYDSSAHLSISDVAVDCRSWPRTIQINIKQSKTDPFHQGVHIYLRKTDQDVCPVTAIIPYLAIRGGNPAPISYSKMEGCSHTKSLSQPLTQSCRKYPWRKNVLIPTVLELGQQHQQ